MYFPRFRSKKVPLGLLCLLALTACDLYPDSGKWAGNLTIHDDNWSEGYSCPVEFEVTHTADLVALQNFDLYCGSRSIHWSPGAYHREGIELYDGDRLAGQTYPDGTVRIELRDPFFHDQYPNRVQRLVITWTRIGETLQFTMKEENEGRTRIFESTLGRVH